MQDLVKTELISATECKISLNIPTEIVDKKFNEFFENNKNKAEIPGFRKGKAPLNILKNYFNKKAKAPVAEMLIAEYYSQAIKEQNLNPIGNPRIKDYSPSDGFPGKFDFDNSYAVELIIEVIPKIDPVGYSRLELEFVEINEEILINKKILEYREQFAERTQIIDRGALLGDSVVIDFVGRINNIIFDGGTVKGYTINKLGQTNFISGFEEQIIGMKAGETKQIFVTFPQTYHAAHLIGKDAVFTVTVHGIVESKLSIVDNDLAMMIGLTSVDELNSKVKEDIQKDVRAQLRQKMDSQIISKLLELNKFEAPKSLVGAELQRLRNSIKADKLPEEFMADLKRNAEYNVKRAMLVEAIYGKESSIEVLPEELNILLEEHAKINNKTKDELISALYNSKQMDQFVGILKFSKVIDFIINNAKRKENQEQKENGDKE